MAAVVDELQQVASVSPFRAEFRKKQAEDIKKAQDSPAADGDYYAVVEFDTAAERTQWLTAHGFSESAQYLTFEQVKGLVRRKQEKPA